EDREIAGAREATRAEQRLQVAQRLRVAVGKGEDAVDEVGARQVEPFAGDGLALVLEQVLRLVSEERLDLLEVGCVAHELTLRFAKPAPRPSVGRPRSARSILALA